MTGGEDVGTDGSAPSILLPSACQRICLYPNQETVNGISENGCKTSTDADQHTEIYGEPPISTEFELRLLETERSNNHARCSETTRQIEKQSGSMEKPMTTKVLMQDLVLDYSLLSPFAL